MSPDQLRIRSELQELFQNLGLLPFTAQDVAESILQDYKAATTLRMLTGEAILLMKHGGRGLQEQQ